MSLVDLRSRPIRLLPSGSEQRAAEMLARWDINPQNRSVASQGALPTMAGPGVEPRRP